MLEKAWNVPFIQYFYKMLQNHFLFELGKYHILKGNIVHQKETVTNLHAKQI